MPSGTRSLVLIVEDTDAPDPTAPKMTSVHWLLYNIPPGTQPGSVLRLKNKGLPEFGTGHHGVMYLRIDVKVPEKLSREERVLYERLRNMEPSWKFWK